MVPYVFPRHGQVYVYPFGSRALQLFLPTDPSIGSDRVALQHHLRSTELLEIDFAVNPFARCVSTTIILQFQVPRIWVLTPPKSINTKEYQNGTMRLACFKWNWSTIYTKIYLGVVLLCSSTTQLDRAHFSWVERRKDGWNTPAFNHI